MTTPSEQVRGPQDLVAFMNEATSEEWDKIPFPAQQQLGYHDRLGAMSINDYTGKSPQELVHNEAQSNVTDDTAKLSSFVDYHLESTAPPAEPAGAPGSSGYNNLNRGVPAAKGFENDSEHTVTQTAGGRVVQYAPDQSLSPEEQAKVDGVGPYVPAPVQIVPGQNADGEKYGTANGVLHGQSETFDAEQSNSKDLSDIAAKQAKSRQTASASAAPENGAPAGSSGSGSGSGSGALTDDAASGDEIPQGSIDKVLAWVGEDKDRAKQALDAEQAKPEPRQSLIARLNAI